MNFVMFFASFLEIPVVNHFDHHSGILISFFCITTHFAFSEYPPGLSTKSKREILQSTPTLSPIYCMLSLLQWHVLEYCY